MKNWMRRTASAILALALLHGSAAYAAKVVIDPGHGGADPGAIGVNGLYEKTVNRAISLKLRDELVRRGYTAVLTSETDQTLSLQERVNIKERLKADVFVSIHANWYHSPDVSGTLVLYYDNRYPQPQYPASPEMAALTPKSRELAQLVVDEVSRSAGTVNRGIVPSSVYVVRNGTMPSILVETGFLSNPVEAEKLKDEEFQRKIAIGIANGIERFLPLAFSDIAGHWARDAIVRLYEQGIVEGFDSRYAPERALTRAEFLAMADRVFHFTEWELDEEAPPAETKEPEQAESPQPEAGKQPANAVQGENGGSEEPSSDNAGGANDSASSPVPDNAAGGQAESAPSSVPGSAAEGQTESAPSSVPGSAVDEQADSVSAAVPDNAAVGRTESTPSSVRNSVTVGQASSASAPATGDSIDRFADSASTPARDSATVEQADSASSSAPGSVAEGRADSTPQPVPDESAEEAARAVTSPTEQAVHDGAASEVAAEPSQTPADAPVREPVFADLPESHWSYAIVQKAARLGIIQGYADGTVRPDRPVTRAEMAVLFDRLWRLDTVGAVNDTSFIDVDPDSWYADAVHRLVAAGLLEGVGGGRFLPHAPMTRAQAAVIFDRFLSKYGEHLETGNRE